MTTVTKKGVARAIADVSEGTILATVDIAAPPERVWKAISSNEITQWWGSDDDYRTTEFTADLRQGGKWRSVGKSKDGNAFAVEGEFLEVDSPTKLVQTWVAPWDGNHVTTVTWRLEPIDGGTRVTLKHTGFEGRTESCQGHSDGWGRVLGFLSGFAAPQSTSQVYLCRLLSPRATFMHDMNAAETAAMKAHAQYWQALATEGVALLFGPVADPKGGWGVGILEVRDPAHLHALQAGDPAITSGIGLQYESLPMPRVIRGA